MLLNWNVETKPRGRGEWHHTLSFNHTRTYVDENNEMVSFTKKRFTKFEIEKYTMKKNNHEQTKRDYFVSLTDKRKIHEKVKKW